MVRQAGGSLALRRPEPTLGYRVCEEDDMTGCIYYRAGHCVSPNRCQYKVKGKLGPECAKAGELGEVEKSSEVYLRRKDAIN